MNAALALFALLFGLAQAEPDLPKRAPIAHLAGFESVSSVRFASEPERVHRLVATHVFPARVRWLMTLPNEASKARTVFYRAGDRWFAHDDGATNSRELADAEREQLDHFFALRQALVLWPHGANWQGSGDERRATVDESATLHAKLGAGALPTSIRWLDATGTELEALQEIVWRADGNRALPASFALARTGEVTWRETVESVEFEVAYLDDYFTPLDRRSREATTEREIVCERVEVPTRYVRSLEIDLATADWNELCRRALAARDAFAKLPATLGLKLADGVELELDQVGKPVAAFARLSDDQTGAPTEWRRRPGASALSLRFAPDRTSTAAALAILLGRVPAGARAGTAYVRLAGGSTGAGTQLVLPLVPPR
ncbi:MAG: hypothetical protein HZA52_09070 [Planctomycetes bacterium]|nr:hypothetical protein [Planctomycetota bacterium]